MFNLEEFIQLVIELAVSHVLWVERRDFEPWLVSRAEQGEAEPGVTGLQQKSLDQHLLVHFN